METPSRASDDDDRRTLADPTLDVVPPRIFPEQVGKLGRYIVHEKLGAGGMGIVYSAFDPRLDRSIALKVLHSGGGGSLVGGDDGRLLREAQAMARLSHPNVVGVHDVGTIDDRVFVAMELVTGGTLTQFQRTPDRRWREVLDAYVLAGRGLAAAHEAGLVHGDFKPDNVLIGKDGRPRVVDFGLARLVDRERERPTDETVSGPPIELLRTGLRAGTPAYMAPEQHLGEEPTPAADQFAFCVALYEGLYGRRPFPAETLANLVIEVLEGEPRPPPSESSVPGWVWRVLRRGLAREPDARWPGMTQLLAELSADPQARRRRIVLGGLALAAVGGAAWTAARATAVPVPCTSARARLEEVWNDERRAELRRAFDATGVPWAADSLATTVQSLDAFGDDWVTAHTEACRATAVEGVQSEQVLDLRMACLERRRDELDALVGVLVGADVAVVREASSAAQRLTPVDECARVEALTQLAAQPSDPAQREAIAAVARELSRAHALAAAGRPRDAAEQLAALVPRARELGYAPLLAEVLAHHGELASRRGETWAEATLEESVWTAVRAGADSIAARAAVELTHFVGYGNARPAEAERWFELAHALIDRTGGTPAQLVRLYVTRGAIALEQGDLDEATRSFAGARELARAELGPDDRLQGLASTAVANDLFMRGKLDESLVLYEEALALFERTLGAAHPATGDVVSNIGSVHWARGDTDLARSWYERALAITEATHGPMHPDVAAALVNLAATYDQQSRYAEARPLLERALAIYETTLGPTHPDLVDTLHNLGIVLEALGELDAAVAMARRAVAIQDASFGPSHPDTISTLRSLASMLAQQGKQAERAELLERALAISSRVHGADAKETRELETRLADARARAAD